MAGRAVGSFVVLLPQAAGDQGIESHTGAHCHRDNQCLDGESQRHGGECVVPHPGYEDTIHDVVHRPG